MAGGQAGWTEVQAGCQAGCASLPLQTNLQSAPTASHTSLTALGLAVCQALVLAQVDGAFCSGGELSLWSRQRPRVVAVQLSSRACVLYPTTYLNLVALHPPAIRKNPAKDRSTILQTSPPASDHRARRHPHSIVQGGPAGGSRPPRPAPHGGPCRGVGAKLGMPWALALPCHAKQRHARRNQRQDVAEQVPSGAEVWSRVTLNPCSVRLPPRAAHSSPSRQSWDPLPQQTQYPTETQQGSAWSRTVGPAAAWRCDPAVHPAHATHPCVILVLLVAKTVPMHEVELYSLIP